MQSHGIISNVTQTGIKIKFFNFIWGWCPISELSDSFIENPEDIFKKGQVVACRVLTNRKSSLLLTLKVRSFP